MELNKPSNAIALRIIEDNLAKKEKFLDLGNCGLTDDFFTTNVLSEHTHLEGINLGRYYYKDGHPVYSDYKIESSFNKGAAPHSSNTLSIIPQNLPLGIKELYMNKNALVDVSGINLYTQLQFFDAYGNNIKSLRGLKEQKNMVSFGVSNNQLTDLDGLEAFPNLVYLYAGENKIKTISAETINYFKQLNTLHLYRNELEDVSFLKGNKSIQHLFLSSNKIANINVLFNLSYLNVVDVTQNPLETKIPEEVIDAKNALAIRLALRQISLPRLLIEENEERKDPFLDLGNCGLHDNSIELQMLKICDHLEGLSLGTGYFDEYGLYVSSANNAGPNNVTKIPVTALPANLKFLQMRELSIGNVLLDDRLKKLELLDLSLNYITEINGLADLINLKELALHGNRIKAIINIDFPPNLQILHLSGNEIENLAGIEKCLQLKQLLLFDNKITSIQPLVALSQLEVLNLTNNPIVDCPSDIWTSNNINQIIAYFNEIKSTNVNNNFIAADNSLTDYSDVKLIILGNSNTGKTHLVHFLETGKFLNERNSTHGLNVLRWKPDIKRFPQLTNVEVSIWDFGGQEYYHEAYKLFLGNDAVYIVLWSDDSDADRKQEEYLENGGPKVLIDHFEKTYWLDTLQYFKGDNKDTPIILVQNKVDEDNKKKRISQDLHNDYQINESFHISIKKGVEESGQRRRDLNNFADYLADTLASLANKAQLPPACKKVRNELLHYKQSIFSKEIEQDFYLETEKFYKVCKESPEIVSENYQHFPVWLNRGGSLVYFDKNINLNQYIFISPCSLSQNIYTILNRDILKCDGELAIKTGENVDKKDEITINAMKSFGLLYEHPIKPTTHYLAPQYLPEDHPIEDLFTIASANAWEDSFWIKVPMFFYKKLMHWLLLYFIKDTNSKAKYFWKNGIIILRKIENSDSEIKILIKGLYTKDEINLNKKEGIIQVSVEGADKTVQKQIFATILNYKDVDDDNTNINTSVQGITANDPFNRQNLFLSKLSLSVDKINFDKYTDLKNFYDNPQSDIKNVLIKYRSIVPFDIKGTEPKNVFVSYSHKNTQWVTKIKNQLIGLRRSNFIKDWTDQEILPGEKWDKKILEQIKKADVFILLLSADFMASDYIWDVELKKAFERKSPFPKIIPIYIESFDFEAIPAIAGIKISDLQMIPKKVATQELIPISSWDNEAEALREVAIAIKRTIQEATP